MTWAEYEMAPPRMNPPADLIPDQSDVRMALHSTYLEYAEASSAKGARFEAEIWRQAAEIARGFVTRRVVKL